MDYLTSKTWSCFVDDCNFTVTKIKNELVDFRRSLGLARFNHLRKHFPNLVELESNNEYWKKQPISKRDERLRRKI